jgi:hypothetical protein
MKSFFARAYQTFIEGRQLKAQQVLRDHAHILDKYQPRTEAEIEEPAVLVAQEMLRERAA